MRLEHNVTNAVPEFGVPKSRWYWISSVTLTQRYTLFASHVMANCPMR